VIETLPQLLTFALTRPLVIMTLLVLMLAFSVISAKRLSAKGWLFLQSGLIVWGIAGIHFASESLSLSWSQSADRMIMAAMLAFVCAGLSRWLQPRYQYGFYVIVLLLLLLMLAGPAAERLISRPYVHLPWLFFAFAGRYVPVKTALSWIPGLLLAILLMAFIIFAYRISWFSTSEAAFLLLLLTLFGLICQWRYQRASILMPWLVFAGYILVIRMALFGTMEVPSLLLLCCLSTASLWLLTERSQKI